MSKEEKILSVFIDESGDFGKFEKHAWCLRWGRSICHLPFAICHLAVPLGGLYMADNTIIEATHSNAYGGR